ncbi:MAG: hypothetical protein Q4D62_06375 [Planctomycetia bacterium]|nr:hypothetical protein [Planctomycetia bacterium]
MKINIWLGTAFLLIGLGNLQAEEPVRLAELLETMISGPSLANDGGSTFENAKPHVAGPHEAVLAQWEQICLRATAPGNEAQKKEVVRQMKEALASDAVPVWLKVWLVKQFQWIGEDSDVSALAVFLTHTEYTLRDEAIRVLSKIPGTRGKEVLTAALAQAHDTDRQMIQSALKQQTQDISTAMESEWPQCLPYATSEAVSEYMRDYATFSVAKKLRTLASLTVLGDRKYLPVVREAIRAEGADAEALKRAGILALEKLGTAEDLPTLLEYAATDRNLVFRILCVLEADGLDAALLKTLRETTDTQSFTLLAEILAGRYSSELFPVLLTRMQEPKCENRAAIFQAACSVATSENIGDLLDILLLFPAGGEREGAEKSLMLLSDGNSQWVRAKITSENLPEYLPLLGRIGDDAAWQVIEENLTSSANREVAIHALCNLPNAKQNQQMLQVVDGADFHESQKISALRAYIRVVSLPDDQIGISASAADKLAMLRIAMSKATRVEEKKLILSRLSAIRDIASVRFAMEFVDDPQLEQDVYRAVVDLAHHNNLRRPNVEYFTSLLNRVIEKCTDSHLVERAKKYHPNLPH